MLTKDIDRASVRGLPAWGPLRCGERWGRCCRWPPSTLQPPCLLKVGLLSWKLHSSVDVLPACGPLCRVPGVGGLTSLRQRLRVWIAAPGRLSQPRQHQRTRALRWCTGRAQAQGSQVPRPLEGRVAYVALQRVEEAVFSSGGVTGHWGS